MKGAGPGGGGGLERRLRQAAIWARVFFELAVEVGVLFGFVGLVGDVVGEALL